MTYDDKKRFIVNTAFLVTVGGIILFIVKYVLGWLAPFIVGLIIAFMLQPVARGISFLTRIKSKAVIFFVLSAFYAGVGSLIWLLIIFAIAQATNFIQKWPIIYQSYMEPLLFDFMDWIMPYLVELSPVVAANLSQVMSSIIAQTASVVGNISTNVLGYITMMMTHIPIYLLTLIFTIVLSVFISLNYHMVTSFLVRQLPEKGKAILFEAKEFLSVKLVKMMKAYMIIMFITFSEVALGLTILRVNAAMNIGLIVAIFDIMPFLGTGGILVPWAIFELVTGDIYMGVGIFILYLFVTIVRNIVEPRIVGQQIGLHPIVTITAMFAGLKIFGFAGFIGFPLIVLFLKHLQDTGVIRLWK